MAVPIARRRHRVDRVQLVAGRHQGGDEQTPVGLDADYHLGRILRVGADQLVEASNAVHPFRQPGLGQPPALPVCHVHVVMGLRPVHSYKDHPVATFQLVGPAPTVSLEVASSPLMDQCSKHDIPPAVTATSQTNRGTI